MRRLVHITDEVNQTLQRIEPFLVWGVERKHHCLPFDCRNHALAANAALGCGKAAAVTGEFEVMLSSRNWIFTFVRAGRHQDQCSAKFLSQQLINLSAGLVYALNERQASDDRIALTSPGVGCFSPQHQRQAHRKTSQTKGIFVCNASGQEFNHGRR